MGLLIPVWRVRILLPVPIAMWGERGRVINSRSYFREQRYESGNK